MHALAHIFGTASIAVAQLMFIVHNWFTCMPDFLVARLWLHGHDLVENVDKFQSGDNAEQNSFETRPYPTIK